MLFNLIKFKLNILSLRTLGEIKVSVPRVAFEISDRDGNLRGWKGGFSYNSGSDTVDFRHLS